MYFCAFPFYDDDNLLLLSTILSKLILWPWAGSYALRSLFSLSDLLIPILEEKTQKYRRFSIAVWKKCNVLTLLSSSLCSFSFLFPLFVNFYSSLFQQNNISQGNWWWGVWEKQDLLPWDWRAPPGGDEWEERWGSCSRAEPYSFCWPVPPWMPALFRTWLTMHTSLHLCNRA